MRNLADEFDDWLYSDEADEANLTVVRSKIRKMTEIIDPAEIRHHEWKIRPKVLDDAFNYMQSLVNFTNNDTYFRTVKPWFTDEERFDMMK